MLLKWVLVAVIAGLHVVALLLGILLRRRKRRREGASSERLAHR